MYDVSVLKTQEDCRLVMKRAKERGDDQFYRVVFKRICDIMGDQYDDPDDPMIREFYEGLAAYEQILTEKNGRTTSALRTRQKIKNKGIHQSLQEWACGKVETNGFNLLVEHGMPEYSAEYMVAKYEDRFPDNVVALAKRRLAEYGILWRP